MSHPSIGRLLLLCVAAIGLTAVGCGDKGPPIAPVTGTVTFEGQPLPGPAVIHFMSDEGFGSSCEVLDGQFSLGSQYGAGVPLGRYEIAIGPPVPSPSQVKARTHPTYDYIPQAYRDFPTNDFVAEVTADGDNTFAFDMKR